MTEVDRRWIAYCALGAAVVIRAPSWGWAVLLVAWVLWTAASLREWAATRWKARSADDARDAELAESRARFADRPRADKTVVIPRAAPATVTEVVDRLHLGGFEPLSGMDAATKADLLKVGAEVNRVVVSGSVWTTDELLREIRKTIERGRPSGGSRV